MQLSTSRPADELRSELARLWFAALRDVVIRHPNRRSTVLAHLTDDKEPVLTLSLDVTHDSRDMEKDAWSPFTIAGTRLTYFPGVDLARQWLAAAWFGYVGHEALELCSVGDLVTRPLDPHQEPFYFDRSLRVGFPVKLTPQSLRSTLCLVMEPPIADGLIARAEVG